MLRISHPAYGSKILMAGLLSVLPATVSLAQEGSDFIAPSFRSEPNAINVSYDDFVGFNDLGPFSPDGGLSAATGITLQVSESTSTTIASSQNLYDPSGTPTYNVTIPGSSIPNPNGYNFARIVLQTATNGNAIDVTSPTVDGIAGVNNQLSSVNAPFNPITPAPLVGETAINANMVIGGLLDGLLNGSGPGPDGFNELIAVGAFNSGSPVDAALTGALFGTGFVGFDFDVLYPDVSGGPVALDDFISFNSINWVGFPSEANQEFFEFFVPFDGSDLSLVFQASGSNVSLQAVELDVIAVSTIPEPTTAAMVIAMASGLLIRRRKGREGRKA